MRTSQHPEVNTRFDSEKLADAIKEKRGVKPRTEKSLRRATEEIKTLGGDMNLTTLQRMEQGSHIPSVENLYSVCVWLGVPMETFFTESGNQTPAPVGEVG